MGPLRTDREKAVDRFWALCTKADSTTFPAERESLLAKATELRDRWQLTQSDFIRRGLANERGPVNQRSPQPPPQQQQVVLINGVAYAVPLGMDAMAYGMQLIAMMQHQQVAYQNGYTAGNTGNTTFHWTYGG